MCPTAFDLFKHALSVFTLLGRLCPLIIQNGDRFSEQHWQIVLVANSRNDVWMSKQHSSVNQHSSTFLIRHKP
ncbi:Unknown protein sequence [Pseudomonas syringae pv. maculicola]|nr:Unknown protein sequence [Pseudomonas syringae pv. maculicola]